ncbi:MAG: hypothetical protein KGI93_11905 [Acidobacteriota bacterium]|nr:hypothetical protein [Acidobacteriota bacterium]MDE3189439.1 hypothetical protein [Acidobacteriota bacterium]
MDERYPIGETESVAVAVLRHDGGEGYGRWTVAVGLRGGEATVHVPGHYPSVLAGRLRAADGRFLAGARLGRDEYLDLTALVRDGEETLALSSSARLPVRVTVEVPREQLLLLSILLDDAQKLIEELRQGLGAVPDSVPDAF